MGQKVHPLGLRLGINANWRSRWFADKAVYAEYVREDIEVRALLKERLPNAGVAQIDIERGPGEVTILIHTSRPGVIIGRGGAGTTDLKKRFEQLIQRGRRGKVAETQKVHVKIDIVEVRQPEANAQLIAESIKYQLEKRVMFKRAMKQAVEKAVAQHVLGIRIILAGRLGGADIARSEKLAQGTVPLSTLRGIIDYGFAEALTTFGTIGVKVWIYRGEDNSLPLDRPAARRISA